MLVQYIHIMKCAKVILFIVITLTLLSKVIPSYGLRILGIFPLHMKSHFVMCESLMRGLAERGHQVHVYSQFPLKNPPPNYTDFSLALPEIQITNNMTYARIKNLYYGTFIKNTMKQMRPMNELLGLPILQKLIRNPPHYDVVVTAPFMMNCFFAFGRLLNIPMVHVVTFPTLLDWMYEPLGSPVNLASEPSIFIQLSNPMTFFDRLENMVRSTLTAYTFNYYVREQDAVVEKYFGPGFPNVVELQKDISLVLLNYNPAFNDIRTFSPNVIPVGGLHIAVESHVDLSKNIQQFLNEAEEGFIYVSFGSNIRFETFPKPILGAFYETFRKIAPIRVLMKIAIPEELPPGLPSNVVTEQWIPQIKVLKHKNIKIFITHGGLMGTQEAIYHGVPLIGIPIYIDQFFNMQSYVRRHLAITLDDTKITEKTLTKAVTEILNNPIYKKSAEQAGNKMRDVPMNPIDTAAFWVEYISRHGKHALRPPVVDLPWWQAALLDVYVFILTLILIILFIINVILKKIMFMFSSKKMSVEINRKIKTN